MAKQPTPSPFLLTPPAKTVARGGWLWRFILILFLGLLVYRAVHIRNTPFEQVDWDIKNHRAVAAWVGGLVQRELIVLGLAFVLGLLTPPALFGPTTMIEDWKGRWLVRLLWWGFGPAVMAICFFIAWEELPPVAALVLPFLSFLIGVRLSSAAQRGGKAFVWAFGQIAVLFLVLAGGAVFVASKTVSDTALQIDPTEMRDSDKRLLAQRIRDTRPPEGEPRKVQLSDAEINALATSVLNRGNSPYKASFHFEPSSIAAQASLPLPEEIGAGKFLNVRALGHFAIDEGTVDFGVEELQLGDLKLPRPVVQMISGTVHTMLMEDPQIQRITEAVDKLQTQQGAINMQVESGAISRQIIPSLTQLLWKQPDVAAETTEYVQHLLAFNSKLPADADRFGVLFQEAFKLAEERSKEHDPVLENRAAIFALAILFGHQELEPFIGEVLDANTRKKADEMIGTAKLRGRQDLPRHFLVSAALALLAGESVSDRIGVMKEQIDSQEGGTGFSFVDMLANMSGTRLAVNATRDVPTARSAQLRFTKKFEVDKVFPSIDGLPEDIADTELQIRFGGVGGTGYQEQMDDIKRRLDSLPKL
jgi:hypothetical protein